MTAPTPPARIVITGSTRGLGFQLAREFLRRGCAVVVSGRSREAVDAALANLRAEFANVVVHGIACDVTRPDQVQALWDGQLRSAARMAAAGSKSTDAGRRGACGTQRPWPGSGSC